MPWEIFERINVGRGNYPPWWNDMNVPGVRIQKTRLVFNKAMSDVLKVQVGSLLLVLIDRKGDAIGFRSPQPGEELSAVTVGKQGKTVHLSVSGPTRLTRVFPWIKSGMTMKAELVENGSSAMMVIRNKL